MPFFWDWVWEKLSGVSKTAEKPQSVGRTEMDNQVREEVVRNGREIPAKESNTSVKPKRVRSNNTSKAGRKSPRKAVRPSTQRDKSKSKTVQKG
jgi:hypothetical protein